MSGHKRQSLNVYVGEIGETVALKYLSQDGFHIMSYMILTDFLKRSSYDRSIASRFLGSMTENFIHLNKKLDEIYAGKEHRRRRFDFVAKKAGKYYIVEIKTNKARLNEFEKEGLLLCKRFGFIPLLVRTKVTLIADLDDVTLQLL